MSAIKFQIVRGDTAAKLLTIVKRDSPQTAVDLTGLTLTISADQIQNPADETTQLFKKVMIVTSAVAGEAEFSLTTGDWVGIADGRYWFDIQAVDGVLVIQTLMKGRFEVIQDLNKD